MAAVRELRKSLGDTQQQFANRLNLAISTVVRYELSRPPKGMMLGMFERLAAKNGRQDLAQVFQHALVAEVEAYQPGRMAFWAPEGQEAEVMAFTNILQLPRLAETRARVLALLRDEVQHCKVVLGAGALQKQELKAEKSKRRRK